jgi:hypothetical protein
VIRTSKVDRARAEAYCTYIIKSIKDKPLFGWLELTPRTYWQYALWMDPSNHGGVLAEAAAPGTAVAAVDGDGPTRTCACRLRAPFTWPLVKRPLLVFRARAQRWRCGGTCASICHR